VSGDNCFYDIDPDPVNHQWIPDYPHIKGTYQWLYLSTNEISTSNQWVSKMRRFNINQMANCVGAGLQEFDYTGADSGSLLPPPALVTQCFSNFKRTPAPCESSGGGILTISLTSPTSPLTPPTMELD